MTTDPAGSGALSEFLPPGLRTALWIMTSLVLALIVLPTLYLLIWSLCGTEVVGRLLPLREASFRWYEDVLLNREWRDSLAVSATIAISASFLGTCISAGYDYAKRFTGQYLRVAAWASMVLLLTNPLIAYGMSLRAVASAIDADPWLILVLGHLAVIVPLQFLVFESASRLVDTDMLEAARTLGAGHWRVFRSVYVPNAIQPMVAAAIVGAFVSFDELVIALFTLEGATATVPLRIWRSISDVVEPRPAVVASLVVAAAAVSWSAYEQLNWRNIRTVRSWWERASSMRKEAVGAIAGIAVVRIFLPHGEGAWHVFAEIIAHVLGAIGGGLIVGLWKLRSTLRGMLVTVNAEPRGTRKVARRFVLPGVLEDVEALEGLLGGGLAAMSRTQIRRLTAACFHEFSNGQYIGTDRNVPSRYYELYPDYLETQLAGRSRRGDVRIVMYGRTALENDFASSPEEVMRFLQTHWDTGVLLLCVDWPVAAAAAVRFDLETPDLGIFARRIVLFFLPGPDSDSGRMMLRVVDGPLRQRLQLFLVELVEHSMEVISGTPIAFRELTEDERSSLQAACRLE